MIFCWHKRPWLQVPIPEKSRAPAEGPPSALLRHTSRWVSGGSVPSTGEHPLSSASVQNQNPSHTAGHSRWALNCELSCRLPNTFRHGGGSSVAQWRPVLATPGTVTCRPLCQWDPPGKNAGACKQTRRLLRSGGSVCRDGRCKRSQKTKRWESRICWHLEGRTINSSWRMCVFGAECKC